MMIEEKEIQETIQEIENKLADKKLNRFVNAPVKEGYLKAVEILKKRQTDITKAKLEELKTVQGRAIAALAIDYLKGECAQSILLGVPIKDIWYEHK